MCSICAWILVAAREKRSFYHENPDSSRVNRGHRRLSGLSRGTKVSKLASDWQQLVFSFSPEKMVRSRSPFNETSRLPPVDGLVHREDLTVCLEFRTLIPEESRLRYPRCQNTPFAGILVRVLRCPGYERSTGLRLRSAQVHVVFCCSNRK